ncbi:ANKRD28 [Mytilus coruscus]|uniref:ANKRD28 n=1 Tax=Mytilus coruscus TaxID=42192 RepID=A0A6J8BQL2_MYTCO|nr:ANKRD28 [Mytilus coruscus]
MLDSQSVWYDDANPFHRLLTASQEGNYEQIRHLRHSGVNINRANETGLTALIVAFVANNAQSCQMLLENGAKIDQKDIGGYTALHLTTSIETTNVLLQYINDDNKKELINAKTKYGRTPLHDAALHGPAEKVLVLLTNEALVDAEDLSGSNVSSLYCFTFGYGRYYDN